MYKRFVRPSSGARPTLAEQFGVRSAAQVIGDVRTILGRLAKPDQGTLGPSVVGHFRPSISLPAYAGFVPVSGVSPIMNFFDRVGGGRGFRVTVTKERARDHRGGRLTYDEHDGTDFVCPPGMPVVAAAPGVLVATRDTFLRGGLTACVDHGNGVVTQYTHLTRVLAEVGQSLRRGDVLAWSGSGGLDMVSGFPWVPPHVHFMVWVHGVPVDPYRSAAEPPSRSHWLHGDDPQPSGPLASDAAPPTLETIRVDERGLDRIVEQCKSTTILDEIGRAKHAVTRLAIVEDSLHHDRDAWPAGSFGRPLRPSSNPSSVRLSLPLPASEYRAARPYDSPLTKPRDRG
jgi:murein DD-endopeptidase MepM/ murein hydrolase activator NlpD